MSPVLTMGSFDDLRSRHIRFLEAASREGPLTVYLWSDGVDTAATGKPPKFPEAERLYFLQAIRYVRKVILLTDPVLADRLPLHPAAGQALWVLEEPQATPERRAYCQQNNLRLLVLRSEDLPGFGAAAIALLDSRADKKKVIVTGCYDWFHTGHIRFFEEVSELGELYVVLGHDENVRGLKGPGHPLFPQDERRYVVQSIRFVKQALISTGNGWLDAEPEIRRIKPDIYAVNEDGDRPVKREYCKAHGIEYRVLKRVPKEGLPKRQSTDLRGF